MLITKAVWQTIIDAVERPEKFNAPGSRKPLRAAVESAIEQISNTILGKAARSHEQMIKRLNEWCAQNPKSEHVPLVNYALGILREIDSLEAFSYDDVDDDRFETFIEDHLQPTINLLRYE